MYKLNYELAFRSKVFFKIKKKRIKMDSNKMEFFKANYSM